MPGDLDLGRRLALAPHFSPHVLDDRQILLLSEQRSFRLTGRLYVALVPLLDGSRTGAAIVAAFAGRAPERQISDALGTLLDKGYACYVDDGAPAGRQALWSEMGLVPADAEQRLARRTVAVIAATPSGLAAEGARALRRAARDAGLVLADRKAADVVVVSTDDYLRRDLAALNRRMRRAGKTWLLFKAGGSVPLLGPFFRPDAAPCWACLARCMAENRPGDALVADAAAARPARASSPASVSFAASFAALELARAFADAGPSPLDDGVASFDLATRAWQTHHVRLDPACAVCGQRLSPRQALERAKAPVELVSRPVIVQADGGWRIFGADEVVRRLERYVSPITGVISGLEECSPAPGLPVFRARQTSPVPTSPRANRLIGRPAGAAGKGMSEAQAKASCLAEAMERHLCGFTGHEPRRRAPWSALGKAAPHPNDYLQYSDRQYDGRVAWNERHQGFNWVGERFDDARPVEWTPAWSLTHQALRWLPSRYCFFGYNDPQAAAAKDDHAFCRADSNGCASGSTLEEAILQGFFELIERDACALWWYSRVRRPAFDLDTFDDPFVRRVRAFHDGRDREIAVLDITNDLGIPVAIATSHRRADGKAILLGLGAHFDPEVAVSRALAELNQMSALDQKDPIPEGDTTKLSDDEAVLHDWMTNRSLESEPYCVPEGRTPRGRYARPAVGDLKDAVGLCVRTVGDRGYDMIVHDHARPEIDFSAARVVVPGLRHFWSRFGAGRLYRAPVDMGWLPAPLAEDALNPIPFFL